MNEWMMGQPGADDKQDWEGSNTGKRSYIFARFLFLLFHFLFSTSLFSSFIQEFWIISKDLPKREVTDAQKQ